MEKKKSFKADLERRRSMFFLVGLVVALSFVFMAFEWKTKPRKAELTGGIPIAHIDEELPPIVRDREPEQPELPKPKVIEQITIVDDLTPVNDPVFEPTDPVDYVPVDLPAAVLTSAVEPEETIFVNTVEKPAEFPGGERALYRYISDHVKYPVIAQENGIQGKVYVNFVVDENGNAINVLVPRSVDPSLDAEAIRVIESLPRFRPAMQSGKNVKVYYTAIINFQLQN